MYQKVLLRKTKQNSNHDNKMKKEEKKQYQKKTILRFSGISIPENFVTSLAKG